MTPDAAHDVRNAALRLTFVVTAGLLIETLRGTIMPPLAPVIAIQLLAGSTSAPGRKALISMLVLMAGSAMAAYVIVSISQVATGLYAIAVMLLYLWGFFIAFRPKGAVPGGLILTMSIIVSVNMVASSDLAFSLILEQVIAIPIGFALTYVAHGFFPHRSEQNDDDNDANTNEIAGLSAATRAIIATAIILPLHLYMTSDGTAALIVLLTSATLLRQPGLTESLRYSMAFASGNALGASLAAFSIFIMTLHGSITMLTLLLVACGLALSLFVMQSPKRYPLTGPAFVAYTMLFGLTLSSTLPVDGVDVIARVAMIMTATAYVLAAVSLCLPFVQPPRTSHHRQTQHPPSATTRA